MITLISDRLAAAIAPQLNWSETVAGIAKPVKFTDRTADGVMTRVMPVACGEACEDGQRYFNLVPDSEKKSIIYFEDFGTRIKEKDSRRYDCEVTLRLVCWMNLQKIGITDCTLSAVAVSQVLSAVPLQLPDEVPFNQLVFRVTDQLPRTPAIFERYTYNESVNQYLMWPYDYFALMIYGRFLFTRGCELPVTPTPPVCP